MKSKTLKKEILQLVQDQEQYQLYMRSKGSKLKRKRNQDSPSTKWDIVLLVFVVIIVYFILYKIIMIVIQIKIVNENADRSSQLAIQKPYPIKSNQPVNTIKNINQNTAISNNERKTVEQNTEIASTPQANKVESPLLNQEQIQKLMTQQNLKAQQQQLLAKLRQNMLQQTKLQKAQGTQSSNIPPQLPAQNNIAKQVQPTSTAVVTSTPSTQVAKQATVPTPATASANRAGISGDTLAMAVKLVNLKNLPKQDPLAVTQRNYYQQKYHLSKYTQQLSFCVIVPSFNNVANNRYLNNINSILQQEYSNYHIVFIDDASTDQTFNKLDEYLKTKQLPEGRIKMIKNEKQMFAMYNLRKSAMEYCQPEQIFMIVDGDDELLGRQVFRFFNAMFQEKKAYFIFTNFITIRGSMGYSRQFPQRTKKDNSYRSYPFVTSHLRAYYTKLFQLIDDKDLRDEKGDYYRAANDVAICIPILEMAHTRVEYIPQISYVYNAATGLNNHKLRLSEQKSNDRKIRSKKKYSEVKNIFQVDNQRQIAQIQLQKQQEQSQLANKNIQGKPN